MSTEIRVLPLLPAYKIVVFSMTHAQTVCSLRTGTVCYNGDSCVNEFLNQRDVNVSHHRMLGRVSELTDKKCKLMFDEARHKGELYPSFIDKVPDTASPLQSFKNYLFSEGWEHPHDRTWVIVPKPARKLNGNHTILKFALAHPTFRHESYSMELPVYHNKITADTSDILYHVEIPDYLYDFVMQCPEEDKRPKSKVISCTLISLLRENLNSLSTTAIETTSFAEKMATAKKVIIIKFGASQKAQRDPYQFGYAGLKTSINFNFFVAYEINEGMFGRQHRFYVDKRYEQGKGFVPVKKWLARIDMQTQYNVIPWLDTREEFLTLVEQKFERLATQLNDFLKDMTEEKLDILIKSKEQLFITN